MSHYSTIFVAAMPDEMQALTTLLTTKAETFTEESAVLANTPAQISSTLTQASSSPTQISDSPAQGSNSTAQILCVTSGIGMVNAAAILAATLKIHSCDRVICFGSAGGLSPDARVQQVVIGTEYINGGADGTAFGYVRGQVPGEPPVFTADAELLKTAQNLNNTSPSTQKEMETVPGELKLEIRQELNGEEKKTKAENKTTDAPKLRFAPMTSSDFFVTEKNVGDVRELFPNAVTADMETQAFAQVCSKAQVPFIAVRAISDLCGNPDDQSVSFHSELSIVAKLAAETAFTIHNLATAN